MEEVLALLDGLASADNVVRQHAECRTTELSQTHPSELVLRLMDAMMSAAVPVHLRSLGTIMLRRLLLEGPDGVGSADVGFLRLQGAVQEQLKTQLLTALVQEGDQVVRKHIADLAGRLAAFVLAQTDWPQLLPFTQQLLQSQNTLDRESGLRLIEWLIMSDDYVPIFTSPESLPSVLSTFKMGLSDLSNQGRVMLAAMKAVCGLVTTTRLESSVDELRVIAGDAIGGMLALARKDSGFPESNATDYISCLISIASEKPTFFGSSQLVPTLSVIIELFQQQAATQNLPRAVRNQLVEFIVTICEGVPREVRRLKEACPAILNLLVSLMTAMSDSAASLSGRNDDEDCDDEEEHEDGSEEKAIAFIAEDAHDRICSALGVNSTFPVVVEQLKVLIGGTAAPTWQQRHAAMLILGNYISLSARFKDRSVRARHLHEVTGQLLQFSSDPVPRVRLAAFGAMTHLIVAAGDQLPPDNLRALLTASTAGVNVQTNPAARVRCAALMCINNILELLPSEMLEEFSASVLNGVAAALTAGPVIVQEQCVSVLVALAQAIKNPLQLAQFYDSIMPVLSQLLAYANSNQLATLWGHTLECYSVVGEASGSKFRADALAMMHTLAQAGDSSASGGALTLALSPEAQGHVLKVWVRLARCLEGDFLPFLPLVMSKIMPFLTADISSGTGDVDLNDPSLEDNADIDVIETDNGMLVAVRCSAVEEQVAACELVKLLMSSTKSGFFPYIEQTAQALMPLLNSHHEDVRTFALVALPEVVSVVAQSGQRLALEQTLAIIIDQVGQMMRREAVLELIMTGMQVLRKSLRDACTDWTRLDQYERQADSDEAEGSNAIVLTAHNSIPILSLDQLKAISACATGALRDSLQRRAVMRAEAQVHGKDADDDDDEQDFMAFTLEMHYNVCELVGSMLYTHASLFAQIYLEEWHPIALNLVHPHCLKEDRVIACMLLADVLHYSFNDGDDLSNMLAPVMPAFLDCCANGPTPALRRLAAFGLGKAAQRFSLSFAPYFASALGALSTCISRGDEDNKPRGAVTDNAVCAVGAILYTIEQIRSRDPSIVTLDLDLSSMWGQWLGYLPLRDDVDEGRIVARQLCALLLQQTAQPTLFCSQERVTRALQVLVEIRSDSSLTNPNVTAAISSTLEQLGIRN